jgi:hypothetical protein
VRSVRCLVPTEHLLPHVDDLCIALASSLDVRTLRHTVPLLISVFAVYCQPRQAPVGPETNAEKLRY